VKVGLVASFNRPAGNLTGIYLIGPELETKRLEILRQLIPAAVSIGVLANPNYPDVDRQVRELQAAANLVERQIHLVRAATEPEIDAAFATLAQQRVDATILSRWQLATNCRQYIINASSPRLAVWPVTEPTSPMVIAKRETMSAGYSTVKSPPTYRWSSPPKSSSSSI
jgi:putative ABC transport system substrate-binding protein